MIQPAGTQEPAQTASASEALAEEINKTFLKKTRLSHSRLSATQTRANAGGSETSGELRLASTRGTFTDACGALVSSSRGMGLCGIRRSWFEMREVVHTARCNLLKPLAAFVPDLRRQCTAPLGAPRCL